MVWLPAAPTWWFDLLTTEPRVSDVTFADFVGGLLDPRLTFDDLANQGGRKLDRAPTPLEWLPTAVEAVGDRAEVGVASLDELDTECVRLLPATSSHHDEALSPPIGR